LFYRRLQARRSLPDQPLANSRAFMASTFAFSTVKLAITASHASHLTVLDGAGGHGD